MKKKDSYLRVLLIGSAVVMFWRGLWGLMDLVLFPGNELLSYLVSIILGIAILAVTHHLVKELV